MIERSRPHGERPDHGTPATVRLWMACLAILWERLWQALWPAATLAGLVLALALLGAFTALPPIVHGTALVLAIATIALAAYRGIKGFIRPSMADARRRLERDSGLEHRPLETLRDHPAGDDADPQIAALWALHQKRERERLSTKLTVRAPAPGIAARDPWALRGAVVVLLVLALAVSRGEWSDRLVAAVLPGIGGLPAQSTAALDVWIDPPSYTGRAPVFLASHGDNSFGMREIDGSIAIPVPESSRVVARVTDSGRASTPYLHIDTEDHPFEPVDGSTGSFEISHELTDGQWISVRHRGNELGAWPMRIVPDEPPAIRFTEEPTGSSRGTLALPFEAADDYGLAGARALIALDPDTGADDLDRGPIERDLALSSRQPREVSKTSHHDLVAHPWAGLPVEITLEATDGAGQTGTSRTIAITLPERRFNHPVAQEIIDHRRELALNPRTARDDVPIRLVQVGAEADAYDGDPVVFLGLRSAATRLILEHDEQRALTEVSDLLWDLAIRIEDGALGLAEQRLRDAEDALAEALADDQATDAEVEQLLDDLRDTFSEYMAALQEHMMVRFDQSEQMPDVPFDRLGQVMDQQSLESMLDQIRDLAETGARDAAQAMLQEMRDMMEQLQSGAMADMDFGDFPGFDLLEELETLTGEQQALLDRTFQESQRHEPGLMDMDGLMDSPERSGSGEGQPGAEPGDDPDAGEGGQAGPGGPPTADMQEALRRQLGDIMRRMGEAMGDIPGQLGRAEQAMRNSEQALDGQDWRSALDAQNQTLDELRQGSERFTEGLMEQMESMMGFQLQPGGSQSTMPLPGGGNRDPFGRPRPNDGWYAEDGVEIPTEQDLQRTREILETLRERSGEPDRPDIELDYIERLLRRF